MVRRAKFEVNSGFMRSMVELLASRKWPALVVDRTFIMSDLTTIGEDTIDFGWGTRIGGGIPMAADFLNTLLSFFMKCKNANGDECTVLPVYLPKAAMEKFAAQISALSKNSESRVVVVVYVL